MWRNRETYHTIPPKKPKSWVSRTERRSNDRKMLLPILLVAAAPVAPEAADGVVFPPITNATDPWYAGTVISCPR